MRTLVGHEVDRAQLLRAGDIEHVDRRATVRHHRRLLAVRRDGDLVRHLAGGDAGAFFRRRQIDEADGVLALVAYDQRLRERWRGGDQGEGGENGAHG
jgi:hypothetical protein